MDKSLWRVGTITANFLEAALRTDKNHSKSAKRLKIAIAAQFGLPTWKHVDLPKALEYLRYLESPEAKLEKWLDEQVRVL